MAEADIRAYASARGFHERTLERWLAWQEGDREALFAIAANLRAGENHVRDLLEWLEEIALRDSASIRNLLNGPAVIDTLSAPRLGRSDKLKRVKEHFRRARFPRLARIEDAIAARIQRL